MALSAHADADAPLRLDNQLCFVLYALSRKITAEYRPLLETLGLTYPQYLVMLVLWEAQDNTPPEDFAGVTVKFVGERLLLDSGTLTPLLKRLETAGLVQRGRSAVDEREARLRLTDAGLRLREPARQIPQQMLCNSGLPLERLAALRQELRELLVQVCAEG
ncbi:MAG: MarR family transcriptional regulator [Porticoccaceae bacterium]|jgi:DNA-binding MarR family transcriptional regulator